jgi:hypothetical protein
MIVKGLHLAKVVSPFLLYIFAVLDLKADIFQEAQHIGTNNGTIHANMAPVYIFHNSN